MSVIFPKILLQFNELSICDIADAISKDFDYDMLDQLDPEEILQLLHSIGSVTFKINDFHIKSERSREKAMSNMKTAIFEHVKTTCSCII